MAYIVPLKTVDKRSESIIAEEDMYIIAIEHFMGVSGGGTLRIMGTFFQKPDNLGLNGASSFPYCLATLLPHFVLNALAQKILNLFPVGKARVLSILPINVLSP